MYNTLALVFLAFAAVTCNDLQVGSSHGRKIFDEQIQASPAIWRQVQKITINNITDYEVISAVVVTDQRPEKDGIAKIVEGGAGQKNVTVELQSPTVFRGFDFHVVVYAVQDVDDRVDAQHPAVFSKDTDINATAKPEDKNDDNVTSEDIKPTEAASADEKPVEKEGNPSVTTEQTRNTRNTETQQAVDPIVQYVNQEQAAGVAAGQEKTSTQTVNGQEVTTDNARKVDVSVTFTTAKPNVDQELLKVVPQVKDFDVKVLKDQSTTVHTITEAADVTTVRDQTVQQNFDSISKELGQKVVFGFKKN